MRFLPVMQGRAHGDGDGDGERERDDIGSAPRQWGWVPAFAKLERLSLELTRACTKACSFCYNGSSPRGATNWSVAEVLTLAEDCIEHGLRSLSFGGGEPLQYPGLFEILHELQGRCFRSLTTNGLLLDRRMEALVESRPDKVHVSIHFPDDPEEVNRVARQVAQLGEQGIRAGVNLLVRRSQLQRIEEVLGQLVRFGIGLDRTLLLPMRGADAPSAREVARVAGGDRFQSVTCLGACGASHRFASLDWDRRVGWCSYTNTRRQIGSSSYHAIVEALKGLPLQTCAMP